MTSLAAIWEEETAVEIEEAAAAIAAPPVPLLQFVRDGWHVLEPETPFIPNWHADAIAEHLEWVAAGEILRLLINIAPGTAKSLFVSVFWPAWMWTWRPGWRSLFGSYDQDLSTRDAVRSRTLLNSEWYQTTFKPTWKFTVDQNVKSYYRNDKMGERMAVSVEGKGTGFRCNCTAFDDPLNVKKKVFSDLDLDGAIYWWDVAMSSRLNNPAKDARVGIMQRLHERDLTGHLLAKNAGYVHLCLPSEFDPKRRSVTVVNDIEWWRDPRNTYGELLFPQLHTQAWLEEAKKDLGSWQYAAQHQQTPLPSTGGIFQRAWFKRYKPTDAPVVWMEHLQSWDLTFKKKEDTDYVVGELWSRWQAQCYLRYERRDRLGFAETKAAIREMTSSNPEAHAKLIEDKANGPAIIEELRSSIPGIVAVPNNDGVLAHAWAIQPFCEAGNIYIPEGPEGDAWLDEVCAYPKATYDDRVAAFTQAILRLMKNVGQRSQGTDTPVYSEVGTMVKQERW